MSHPLAIITVLYRNYTVLEDFFHSLEAQSDKNFHLFIADLSEEKKPLPTTNLPVTIFSGENLGYAHGVNLGLQKAVEQGHEQFCVINDDTIVDKNFVQILSSVLITHPNTVIGGKIYYASGYEFHKTRYSTNEQGKVLWYAGGVLDWNHVITHHRGVDEVDRGQYDAQEKTEFVTGCLMAFDKKVFDTVGLWDESYFLYYEDSDYTERAKRKHIELLYVPEIVIWHKNAQSTDGSGSKLHETYQSKNRIKFGLKYAPLKTKMHLMKNSFFAALAGKGT